MNWLCKRGWHKFKGRYNTYPPERPLPRLENTNIEKILEKLTKKIHVHDICERCGEVIK